MKRSLILVYIVSIINVLSAQHNLADSINVGDVDSIAYEFGPGIGPVYVSAQEAISIAKSWYNNRTDVDYYLCSTELIDNNFECSAIDLPDSSAWVRNNSHWLVFVDEHPNKNWSHRCGYVYVQCEKEKLNDATKSCMLVGCMPPSNLSMKLVDAHNRYSYMANFKPIVSNSAINNSDVAGRTYALIMDCASNKNENLERYWNDCAFVYRALRRKYQVPADHIYTMIGSGDVATDSVRKADNSGFVYLPIDFDEDGTADTIYPINRYCTYSVINALKQRMTANDQLLIFITGNAGVTIDGSYYYLKMLGNERLPIGEMSNWLNGINARAINIVLGTNQAELAIDALQGKGRVVTASSKYGKESVSCDEIPFTSYLYHWTSAICKADAFGDSIASDADGNGRVTAHEAYSYAKRHSYMTNATIFSVPQSIAEDLAFNNIPDAVDLYIKDMPDDTGKEPVGAINHVVSDYTQYWDSPDIWVRNQEDGYAVQESEPIIINPTSSRKTVYAYVRVRNRGMDAYLQNNKYIHFYWCNSLLCEDRDAFVGILNDYNQYLVGDEVEVMNLHDTIDANGYHIYDFEVSLPRDLVRWIKENGQETVNLNYLARIGSTSNLGFNDQDLVTSFDSIISMIAASNDIAQKVKVFVGPNETLAFRGWNILEEAPNSKLEIMYNEVDSAQYLFDNVDVAFELSPMAYEKWQLGGHTANDVAVYSSNPRKLYFNSKNSYISNITLDEEADSIIMSFDRIANANSLEAQSYQFNIIRRDAENGRILAGMAVQYNAEARSASIEPLISVTEGEGYYELSENNVTETAEYEWFDTKGNAVATGKKAIINAPIANGSYTLKVTAQEDGAVNYASVDLSSMPLIKSISPNPFNNELTIKLNRCVNSGTHIVISGITVPNFHKDFNMKSGEKDITIFTSDYPNGTYAVSIIENGEILDSRQVIK